MSIPLFSQGTAHAALARRRWKQSKSGKTASWTALRFEMETAFAASFCEKDLSRKATTTTATMTPRNQDEEKRFFARRMNAEAPRSKKEDRYEQNTRHTVSHNCG